MDVWTIGLRSLECKEEIEEGVQGRVNMGIDQSYLLFLSRSYHYSFAVEVK
jgi:hypothetical protein